MFRLAYDTCSANLDPDPCMVDLCSRGGGMTGRLPDMTRNQEWRSQETGQSLTKDTTKVDRKMQGMSTGGGKQRASGVDLFQDDGRQLPRRLEDLWPYNCHPQRPRDRLGRCANWLLNLTQGCVGNACLHVRPHQAPLWPRLSRETGGRHGTRLGLRGQGATLAFLESRQRWRRRWEMALVPLESA